MELEVFIGAVTIETEFDKASFNDNPTLSSKNPPSSLWSFSMVSPTLLNSSSFWKLKSFIISYKNPIDSPIRFLKSFLSTDL